MSLKSYCIFVWLVINFAILGINPLAGQQSGHFSNYALNKYGLNVAYAGFDYSLSATGIYRNQWNGLKGNPRSQYLNAHLPLYILNGAGGITVSNDVIGAESRQSVQLSYSYVAKTRAGLFAAGTKLGAQQISLAFDQLIAPDGNYEGNVVQHNDPVLSASLSRVISPELGLAIYYVGNYFEAGISFDNFVPFKNQLGLAEYTISPQLNFIAETYVDLGDGMEIRPSILMYSDLKEIQADAGALFFLPQNIFGGIMLRGYSGTSIDALGITGGWKFNENYTLAYAYDIGLSSLRNVNSGSSELILKYNLNKRIGIGLPPKIIYNPRDL